jgi:hypothetical protein
MATKRVSENKVVLPAAAAAPVRRKSAAPKRVSRPAIEVVAAVPAAESEVQPVVAPAMALTPVESFQDAVARLAYSYWESRGYQGDSPEADWLRAEQELSAK